MLHCFCCCVDSSTVHPDHWPIIQKPISYLVSRLIGEHVVFYVVGFQQIFYFWSISFLPLHSIWFFGSLISVIQGLAPSMSFMVIRPSRRSEGAEILFVERTHRYIELVSATHFMVEKQRGWVEKKRYVDSIDSGRIEPFLVPIVSSTWSITKPCECICLSVVEVHCMTCSKLAGAEKLLAQEEEEVRAQIGALQKGCWDMLRLFQRNLMASNKMCLYCQVSLDNCQCRIVFETHIYIVSYS